MGVINQAILYAAAVLSFLFLPRLVIHRIGHKWTMALSSTGYVLLVAANGYAIWATMVPASRINGLCCGTLWTAKSSYVTLVAAKYASLHGEQKDVIIARFEGIFDFAKLLGGKCRSCWCQTKCIFHTTSSINIVSANGLAEVYISPVCLYMMGALCHTWNHQVFFLERLCVFIWGVHCVTHDIIKRFSYNVCMFLLERCIIVSHMKSSSFSFNYLFTGFVISKVFTSVTLKPSEIHNDTNLYNTSNPGFYCGKHYCPGAAGNITELLEPDPETVSKNDTFKSFKLCLWQVDKILWYR